MSKKNKDDNFEEILDLQEKIEKSESLSNLGKKHITSQQ